jgi:hypothetical protein
MPDPFLMLWAGLASALVSAVGVLLFSWPWKNPNRVRSRAGEAVALGIGTLTGLWLLDRLPHWPPKEDLDRFLFFLVPSAILVECLVTLPKIPSWLAWGFRVFLAGSAPWILLHGSVYLSDVAGPGTRQWTEKEAWFLLSGLGAILFFTWILLTLRLRRPGGRIVTLSLALAFAGASVTVMLSGYLTGGQAGLPLAAGLAGIGVISLILRTIAGAQASLGVGVTGLFGLILCGHFFGELTTTHAFLLFLAPLLIWLPEIAYVRRLPLFLRGILALLLVAVPVTWSVFEAQRKFAENNSATEEEGGINYDDYLK